MAQIFRKSGNSFARATLIGILVCVFGFWAVVYGVYWSSYTTDERIPRIQPVPFSHKHHVSGLGLDCRYCHTTVEKTSFAGIPPTETCMTCHSQVWRDAPVLEPVRNSLATGKPLQWNRVNQLPDFVFFNHSIHVNKGVGCNYCHGPVNQMPITWKAHSLYMRWCLECHANPEQHLRPPDKIFDMNWTAPSNQLELGKQLIKTYHISKQRLDQLRDCSMCHR